MIDVADDILEARVIVGLLHDRGFLKSFADRKIDPGIFVGAHAEWKRRIVVKIVRFHDLYHRAPSLDALVSDFEREARLDGQDHELVAASVRVCLRQALESNPDMAMLGAYLDQQIQTYRALAFVRAMHEAGDRYLVCRFRHGEHELCKGCPVWRRCRGLNQQGVEFSQALFEITRGHLDEIDQASGAKSVETGSLLEAAQTALRGYEHDKKTIADGGSVGVSSPWPTVNRLTGGWIRGKLYAIQAERKTGKTTCLLNCAEAGLQDRARILFCYMEDRPTEMGAKYLSMIAGCSHTDLMLRNLSASEEATLYPRLHEHLDAQKRGDLGTIESLYAPMRGLGLRTLDRTLEVAASEGRGYDLFLFDHMHIADLDSTSGHKSQMLVEFGEGLQGLTRRHNVAGVVASQLKASGDRKGQSRWSDEIEDCFDGVYRLGEEDDQFWLRVAYARFFSKFEIELEDQREIMKLSEKKQVGTYQWPEDMDMAFPLHGNMLEG